MNTNIYIRRLQGSQNNIFQGKILYVRLLNLNTFWERIETVSLGDTGFVIYKERQYPELLGSQGDFFSGRIPFLWERQIKRLWEALKLSSTKTVFFFGFQGSPGGFRKTPFL